MTGPPPLKPSPALVDSDSALADTQSVAQRTLLNMAGREEKQLKAVQALQLLNDRVYIDEYTLASTTNGWQDDYAHSELFFREVVFFPLECQFLLSSLF